jgi:hypothetical protein
MAVGVKVGRCLEHGPLVYICLVALSSGPVGSCCPHDTTSRRVIRLYVQYVLKLGLCFRFGLLWLNQSSGSVSRPLTILQSRLGKARLVECFRDCAL